MTIRNLDAMFQPSSVALFGATERAHTVGSVAARNLLSGGFSGEVYLVNPRRQELFGRPAFPDARHLPAAPDLAVVATPPETVPEILAELGALGTRAAVVISAGFGEGGGPKGSELQQMLGDVARRQRMRLLGPNCFGIAVPRIGLNASFVHINPLPGRLAFATQSGAMMASVLDWATHRRIGFSHFVSLGNMIDVDFGDMLDYLAVDVHTRAVLMYLETVTHARKFMSAARAAARIKPVIVVKAGRYAEGAKAAASHTGALAGNDAVCDAAFRRAGILRVNDMEALFDSVATLALRPPVRGDRLAILTNGGGTGVMAVDTLIFKQGRLAALSPETVGKLNAVLPPTWSQGNPVDLIGDASPAHYSRALEILMEDTAVDAALVIHCPSAIASSTESAYAVAEAVRRKGKAGGRECGVFTSWIGEGAAEGARRLFLEDGIPSYETPTKAVRGFMQMVRYRRSQEALMETPPSTPSGFEPDAEKARSIVNKAMGEDRSWLMETEAKALLDAYRIPVVETRFAGTPEEAAWNASGLKPPFVLKVLSPDILHKSDVGGVAIGLRNPDEVLDRARSMLDRVQASVPDVRVLGFTVQPMEQRLHACELILGMVSDPLFGPVILFGHGGTAVEIIGDKALGLPPLNMKLAHDMMSGTRVIRLLRGYRDVPACDIEAVAFTLVKISQMVCDLDDVVEVDINPLLAYPDGVVALDARVRVMRSGLPPEGRLAIRPYPKHLESTVTLSDGRTFHLRPIRPEDEPGYQELFRTLSADQVRLRFHHAMKTLSHSMAARLTQIDYDREMAFILCGPNAYGASRLCGSVRVSADAEKKKGEFAVLVRSDMAGQGVGSLLVQRIINYSRDQGIGEIYGDVLAENHIMLKLCRKLGFGRKQLPDEPGVYRVSLQTGA